MADNITITQGTGTIVASDEASYSSDTAKIQIIRQVHVDGAEGSKTVKELVRLEDDAHTSGDPGVPALGVRQDTAASLAGTDGDYTMPIFDANGRQHVNVGVSALPTDASTATNQTTIIGHVDGIEGLLTTIDADTSTLAGAVAGTEVQVDVVTAPQPAPPSALVAFITDVPTAGTRVQLASNAVNGVVIQAPSTNTGIVYVGGSLVSSTVYGAELQPGQSTGLAIDNTNKVYVDVSVSGDDVAVIGS